MRKKSIYAAIVICILAIAVIFMGANFFTEIMWFKSTGYLQAFLISVYSNWVVKLLSGFIFFLFLYINLLIAGKKLSDILSQQFQQAIVNNAFSEVFAPKWIKRFILIVSLAMAVVFAAAFSPQWLTLIKNFHGNSFGITDPLFNKDISFYIFNLPFFEVIYNMLFAMFGFTLIIIVLLYIMAYFSQGPAAWIRVLSRQTQVVVLLSLFIALRACGYIISMYHLLYSPRGVGFGASYTDVHAVLRD